MSDLEEFDAMWRDGLVAAAAQVHPASDPRARVAAWVRHRRRVRRTMTASGAAALSAAAVVGVAQIGHGASHVRVATDSTTTTTAVSAPAVPAAVVRVNEAPGGALRITFPGRRTTGQPASVALPSGLIRFEIHVGGAGHVLRIDGVPSFDVVIDKAGTTVTKDVRLEPGTYVMYCAIPGHRAAGEQADLIVGN